MKNKKGDIHVIENYFNAFKKGDLKAVLNCFHPECKIISVKDQVRQQGELHGTYHGLKDAQEFLNIIISLFETESFEIDKIIEADDLVYANGQFTHRVKATGKLFYSEWVQRCIIKDGKIKEYRFYEDSAALMIANQ